MVSPIKKHEVSTETRQIIERLLASAAIKGSILDDAVKLAKAFNELDQAREDEAKVLPGTPLLPRRAPGAHPCG